MTLEKLRWRILWGVLLLAGCDPGLVEVDTGEVVDLDAVDSELAAEGLTGVWKGELGPFTWVNFQRTPAEAGARYLAERNDGTQEKGSYTVRAPAVSMRTSAGVVRALRIQRLSATGIALLNGAGQKFAQLSRTATRVSECQRLVCPSVVDCVERADGAHCSSPDTVASNSSAINRDGVLVLNGKKIFVIGFTMPPPPEAKAPNGKGSIEELRSAGATFLRTGPIGAPWNEEAFVKEKKWQDAAVANDMHTWLYLKEAAMVPSAGSSEDQLLRRIVSTFSTHPGLGVYKGADEPAWGEKPVGPILNTYNLVRQLDPHHPLTIIQAPRNTLAELSAYNPAMDIVGTDIYPVSDPMGVNSHLDNKELSAVGDYTDRMWTIARSRLTVWMTLQIAWSGILPPHTRVMPTPRQERYMAFQAIIHGARGLFFFGGHMPVGWEGTDAQFGWSWTFWNRTLRPVVEQIGEFSPLYPALVAPNSEKPIRIFGDYHGIEYVVREAEGSIFVIAARRNPGSVTVTFRGVPSEIVKADVLYENGRKLAVTRGAFTDTFNQYDVHVYRLR